MNKDDLLDAILGALISIRDYQRTSEMLRRENEQLHKELERWRNESAPDFEEVEGVN